jgi:hypothetical protein
MALLRGDLATALIRTFSEHITVTSWKRFSPVFMFGSNLGIGDSFGADDGAGRLQGGGAENRTGPETDSAEIGALGVTRRPFGGGRS